MSRVQVEEGLERPPNIEDYFDMVAGAGTGGYVRLRLIFTGLMCLIQNCCNDGWETRDPNEEGDDEFRKPCE
jgi:hypothetical protein